MSALQAVLSAVARQHVQAAASAAVRVAVAHTAAVHVAEAVSAAMAAVADNISKVVRSDGYTDNSPNN